ncbi:hypothetical protein DSLASN_45350 [Desulfoluna limicola]|uniref:Uncharacterized protein n=1 Tax=Desulfoluna limicola TaxID=2810562 RepID=A0ABN6F902_9BACT|nr:hypothetical protein DSLASN_45350 [Desulfoluna limicola]
MMLEWIVFSGEIEGGHHLCGLFKKHVTIQLVPPAGRFLKKAPQKLSGSLSPNAMDWGHR